MTFKTPDKFRIRTGRMGSDDSMVGCGAFFIPNRFERGAPLKVIASSDGGWEHVSVSLPHRPPTWDEMCFIKGMFWDDQDTVMELHPPRASYVNNHPHCLHMWRPTDQDIPLPPTHFVGIAGIGADTRTPRQVW